MAFQPLDRGFRFGFLVADDVLGAAAECDLDGHSEILGDSQ
jgi:hypothetical protein